jgi:hypothetical protein
VRIHPDVDTSDELDILDLEPHDIDIAIDDDRDDIHVDRDDGLDDGELRELTSRTAGGRPLPAAEPAATRCAGATDLGPTSRHHHLLPTADRLADAVPLP